MKRQQNLLPTRNNCLDKALTSLSFSGGKFNLFFKCSNHNLDYLVTRPVIPSSSEPGVIHDVVDEEEIFIESFSYSNLLDDKIEAARASLRQLLNHRSASFPPEPAVPVSKRIDPQTVKSNADQSLIFLKDCLGKSNLALRRSIRFLDMKHPWLAPASGKAGSKDLCGV
jgi:hypothetical protein